MCCFLVCVCWFGHISRPVRHLRIKKNNLFHFAVLFWIFCCLVIFRCLFGVSTLKNNCWISLSGYFAVRDISMFGHIPRPVWHLSIKNKPAEFRCSGMMLFGIFCCLVKKKTTPKTCRRREAKQLTNKTENHKDDLTKISKQLKKTQKRWAQLGAEKPKH